MNRVYLVATAASNMEAKVQELVDAVTKAGLIATVYKPLEVFNAADSVAEIKAGKSAVLMEKISITTISLLLSMPRSLPMAKMLNSSAPSACSVVKSALLATLPHRLPNAV